MICEPNHKLMRKADGLYQVVSYNADSVVLRIGDEDERVSRDRIVELPHIKKLPQRG